MASAGTGPAAPIDGALRNVIECMVVNDCDHVSRTGGANLFDR